MKKRCLKVLSLSILLSTFAFTGCGNQIEITFVGDNGSITRKIEKGQNIDADKIPSTPQKPGKYCLWDDVDFSSLTEDTTINYTCYDSVKTLTSNINHSIEVVVSSEEASLDYILKDLQMTATLEDGNVKKLYKGDYKVNENGYSKDVVGNYRVGLAYNNKEIFLSIHVTKITDYVTAVLSSDRGYLNEGLPKITANTEVPGTIKFDDNKTLVIGTKSYNWTFTPSDTNKYAVVHGKSEVNIINATSIVTNKENEVMTFDYGTSKTTIINAIQEGLKVTGTFGNIYREIDSQFYVIDSEYKVGQAGDNIPFTIAYDMNLVATVYVNVKKNENYSVEVSKIERVDIDSTTTLDDILSNIEDYYEASTPGTFEFEEGEVLKVGNYTYAYVFKPSNEYYAVKRGEISINTFKIVDIEIDDAYLPSYDYNSKTDAEIANDIKANLLGVFVYNDDSEIAIDKSKISVTISPLYRKNDPGTYTYTVTYDDVSVTGEFKVNKRVLVDGVDFSVDVVEGTFDPTNSDVMPQFILNNISGDFDETKFKVVPDFSKQPVSMGANVWLYPIILQPDESIAEDFDISEGAAFAFVFN